MNREGIVEHLVIPGSLKELANVHEWTRGMLDRGNVPDDLQHNVLLALSECVTNAIRHGSHEDPSKKVKLECHYMPGSIRFTVRDKGEGFIPEQVPDPTEEAQLYRAGGRGVYLLKALTTETRFESSNAGTSVTFRFAWE